jgi:hypothetical protein
MTARDAKGRFLAAGERDARGRFLSKREAAAKAMMDYVRENPPPRVNRIEPVSAMLTMADIEPLLTMAEYDERYLKPANERWSAEMREQRKRDAWAFGLAALVLSLGSGIAGAESREFPKLVVAGAAEQSIVCDPRPGCSGTFFKTILSP